MDSSVNMDPTQPLLGHNVERSAENRPVVDFDPNGDPDNPLDWRKTYKMGVVSLLGLMAFTVTFTCIGVVPVADQIVFDLEGKESKSASILLVTVWELGEAAGPLIIAPLSEIYGRYAVFNVANLVFLLGVLIGALSPNVNVLIFSRFLTGFAVASNVLNPAIIGDVFPSEARGSGMSLVMLAPLLGGAIGPAISGAIAESLGWRSILWMSAALVVTCELLFFTLFRETYKVTILQRRAARMRQENKDESLKCAWDGEDGVSNMCWTALRTSIARPVTILMDSAVLQIMTLYGGLVFTFYYILATTLPRLLSETYGFSPALIGLGSVGGIVICNTTLDRLYIKLGKSHGSPRPEFRLPLMIGGATFFPAVVAFYGWVPYAQWPASLLLLAVVLFGFFVMQIMVPLSSYIVDAFGLYSASAMTMVLIARCLGGTLLPLAVPPLTEAFGFGYGFLILAAVCLVLLPLPVIVMRYGSRWRQNSVYTRDD